MPAQRTFRTYLPANHANEGNKQELTNSMNRAQSRDSRAKYTDKFVIEAARWYRSFSSGSIGLF
ncbi:MAG: hypothetical protein DWI29_02250 [Planctomycetota bacterium]|nr:MAG: hypothetical protein DWI29_02250 [Planctomycetota bacterium]